MKIKINSMEEMAGGFIKMQKKNGKLDHLRSNQPKKSTRKVYGNYREEKRGGRVYC